MHIANGLEVPSVIILVDHGRLNVLVIRKTLTYQLPRVVVRAGFTTVMKIVNLI